MGAPRRADALSAAFGSTASLSSLGASGHHHHHHGVPRTTGAAAALQGDIEALLLEDVPLTELTAEMAQRHATAEAHAKAITGLRDLPRDAIKVVQQEKQAVDAPLPPAQQEQCVAVLLAAAQHFRPTAHVEWRRRRRRAG
jgi:hypothetical protein